MLRRLRRGGRGWSASEARRKICLQGGMTYFRVGPQCGHGNRSIALVMGLLRTSSHAIVALPDPAYFTRCSVVFRGQS